MTPRIYLAGPDVFDPDPARIFAERGQICRRYGLDPLAPLDTGATTAEEIFRANVGLLDGCDGVVANLTPFRGPHCDVGTAWEVGYAAARGKPVFSFSNAAAESVLDRVAAGARTDPQGMLVEDFGLDENLMIAMSVVAHAVHRDFESAVAAAASYFRRRRVPRE